MKEIYIKTNDIGDLVEALSEKLDEYQKLFKNTGSVLREIDALTKERDDMYIKLNQLKIEINGIVNKLKEYGINDPVTFTETITGREDAE